MRVLGYIIALVVCTVLNELLGIAAGFKLGGLLLIPLIGLVGSALGNAMSYPSSKKDIKEAEEAAKKKAEEEAAKDLTKWFE